jgi:CMP/dCMP kinase
MQKNKIVIAIDGYSSCGKSTVAKALAKTLNITYIDTGAMYRAVTYYCLQHNLIKNNIVDEAKLISEFDKINIRFKYNNDFTQQATFLNDVNIEKEIRGLEVSNSVSFVSKIKEVREKLVELQRYMAGTEGVVMDGRDIGTVVLPNADFKFFMTADSKVRATRRYDELVAKGENPSFEDILQNVNQRDYEDENRTESPLKKAQDAIILDNTNMNQQQQLNWIIDIIEK